jgi:hypothetical protein
MGVEMEAAHAAYLLAIAVGFVSAGIIGSGWRLATGEEPQLGLLLDPFPTLLTPLRVMVIILAAPSIVLVDAFGWLIRQPFFGVPLMAAATVWSFLQGVFILTRVFGL